MVGEERDDVTQNAEPDESDQESDQASPKGTMIQTRAHIKAVPMLVSFGVVVGLFIAAVILTGH